MESSADSGVAGQATGLFLEDPGDAAECLRFGPFRSHRIPPRPTPGMDPWGGGLPGHGILTRTRFRVYTGR